MIPCPLVCLPASHDGPYLVYKHPLCGHPLRMALGLHGQGSYQHCVGCRVHHIQCLFPSQCRKAEQRMARAQPPSCTTFQKADIKDERDGGNRSACPFHNDEKHLPVSCVGPQCRGASPSGQGLGVTRMRSPSHPIPPLRVPASLQLEGL